MNRSKIGTSSDFAKMLGTVESVGMRSKQSQPQCVELHRDPAIEELLSNIIQELWVTYQKVALPPQFGLNQTPLKTSQTKFQNLGCSCYSQK